MSGMVKKTTAGIALALMATGSVIAEEPKFDKKIAKASLEKAKAEIGGLETIRGSFGYDQKPAITVQEDIEKTEPKTSLFSITPAGENKKLPPVVFNDIAGLDYTITGAVPKKAAPVREKMYWEVFNSQGRKIN